jgi:ethanolamine utilization protein EutN
MYLAEVIGTVVATVKYEGLEGYRLMVVKPIRDDGLQLGSAHVALDATQAGVGERVMCVASREAALACDPSFVPIDAAIVGIVDDVSYERERPEVKS